jgi:hypothetical protein
MTFQEFIQEIGNTLDALPMSEIKAAEARIDWAKVRELRRLDYRERSSEDTQLILQTIKIKEDKIRIEQSRRENLTILVQRYLADAGDKIEKRLRQLQIDKLRLFDVWPVPGTSKEFKSSVYLREAEAINEQDVMVVLDLEIQKQKARLAKFPLNGVIKKITEKKTITGNLYWFLNIENRNYILWDYEQEKKLREGQHVYFSIHNDKYGEVIDEIVIVLVEGAERKKTGNVIKNGVVSDIEKERIQSSPSETSSQPSDKKSAKIKTPPKGKFVSALLSGALPTERGSCFLFWERQDSSTVQIESGKFDYRIVWTLIVLASKLIDSFNFGPIFKDAEEFREGVKEMEEASDAVRVEKAYSIKFSDSEFRTILGKQHYSSKNIEKIIDQLSKIRLKIQDFRGLKIIDGRGREHWETYSSSLGPMITLVKEKKKKKKRGLGNTIDTENLYIAYFHSAFGLAFLNNLFTRGFTLLPNKSFFTLSPKAQELFLAICWSKKRTYLTLEQGIRILQWKGLKNSANVSNYKKKFIVVLDELKRSHWIKSWTREESKKRRISQEKYIIEKELKYLKLNAEEQRSIN